MRNDYIKLVETKLNELKINNTSILHSKFLKFLKLYILSEDTDNPITKEDIKLFFKYFLLIKKGNKINVTNKGKAFAIGMDIDTNDSPNKYSLDDINSFLQTKKEKTKEKIRGWVTLMNNEVIQLDGNGDFIK